MRTKTFMATACVAAALAFAAACRQPSSEGVTPNTTPEPPVVEEGISPGNEAVLAVAKKKGYSPEKIARLKDFFRQEKYSKAQALLDRQDMIRPAPAGFVGKPGLPKIKVRMFLERESVRVGEKIRFRAELQNINDETISVYEMPHSFFKTCDLISMTHMKFVVQKPDGKTSELLSPTPLGHGDVVEVRFPAIMTKVEIEKKVDEINRTATARAELRARLAPGETLVTHASPRGTSFCDLTTAYEFDAAGLYRLRLEYDDSNLAVAKEDEPRYREMGFSKDEIDSMNLRANEQMKGAAVSEWTRLEILQ